MVFKYITIQQLIIKSDNQKLEAIKFPSTDKRTNKLWYFHIMVHYLAIKKNELFIQTTLVNLT